MALSAFALLAGLAAGLSAAAPKPCNPHRCPPTTSTSTSTTTVPTAMLFDDEFNGLALDTSKWWATPWCSTSGDDLETCYDTANAFVNGAGQLVLRNSVGTSGRPYDSARVQTFREGSWPPPQVLASVSPPVRVEARILFGKVPGAWGALWADGVTGTGYVELDTQEFRSSVPSIDTCHVHSWGTIAGQYASGFAIDTGQDLSVGWHVYWVDYHGSTVTFGVDALTCGSASSPSQTIGIRLTNQVGVPGTWGGSGGPPPASSLPSDMLVDYVRAWRLPA